MELDIDSTTDNLRGLVGGTIAGSQWDEELVVYYNDDGLDEGLCPNVIAPNLLLVGCLVLFRQTSDEQGRRNSATTHDDLARVRLQVKESMRPINFEYDVPEWQFFENVEDFKKSAADGMPYPQITALRIDDRIYKESKQ